MFLSLGVLSHAETTANAQIKRKLKLELNALQTDLSSATKEIAALRKDKSLLERNLSDLEVWGVAQEQEKLHYYNEAKNLSISVNLIEEQLEKEKKRNAEALARYQRFKKIVSIIFASFLTLLYINYGSKLVSAVSPYLGPYGILLPYVGPVGVFGLGYLLAYIFL